MPTPSESPAADPAEPAGAPRHRPLSFVRRSNRLKPSYQRVWDAALGDHILDVPKGEHDTSVAEGFSIDWAAEFGRSAPLVVEIGSGSGEAVADAAARHPETDFLAVEVYRPGAAQLAARLRREGLGNVRVAVANAPEVLDRLLPASSVSELWVFFPDPWHKKKHNKRRLVQEEFIARAARVLPEGGRWRLATDWSGYAEQMRRLISASDLFRNEHLGERAGQDSPLTDVRLHDLDNLSLGKEVRPLEWEQAVDSEGGWAPRFEGRVRTDFEAKALDAGRRVFDLSFVRTGVSG